MRSSLSFMSAKIAALVTAILTLSDCNSVPPAMAPPAAPPVVVETGPTPFRFPVALAPEKGRALEPPISLTASDGTGLRLVRLTGRAVIEEPLAFTELHLVFENPEDRTIEGNFSITLPDGAQISRFAMKLAEHWQEGEVVEKRRAREAYEDFLHRRQDPALLEQAAGNAFSARVFPIPARDRKELILSYSQEIPAHTTYVLPLRGLPQVGRIDLAVSVGGTGKGAPVEELKRESFTPDADFALDPRYLKGGAGLRSGNLVLARVRPIDASHPDPLASAIVLVDTSASRALGFEAEVRLVERVVQQILASSGPRTPISVAGYDQTTEPIFDGDAGSFGEPELTRIRERQAFGASDLERALGWAGAQAKARGAKRVIVITDGVATAGETGQDKLRAASARLREAGVERLDAIAVGGIRDDALLRQLVTAGLPRAGVVIDSDAGIGAMSKRLTEVTRSGIPVKIEGARFVYPSVLDGVQSGDEVLVYADVPPDQTVRISVDGAAPRAADLVRVERPLLSRAFAQAKISSLLALSAKAGPAPAIERQIVALSVENRVLSPFTSLLVLETERDYARFNIDRRALVDILTIDGGNVAVMKRSWSPLKAPAPMDRDMELGQRRPAQDAQPSSRSAPMAQAAPPPPSGSASVAGGDPMSARGNMWGSEIGDSFGAGGLGLSGVGEGGGGRGEAVGLGRIGVVGHGAGTGSGQGFGSGQQRLSGEHRTPGPTVRMGATQVSGRIPPEIIQRVVRQNYGRFRLCYQQSLTTSPSLTGRVAVRFTILPSGDVANVADAGSDLPAPAVVACVVRAFQGLLFPAPESGSVTVVYPLLFNPGDGGVSAATSSSVAVSASAPIAPARPDPNQPAEAKPYTGRFREVMEMIAKGGVKEAIRVAYAWHQESAGDVMALVALGDAFDAAGEIPSAARAYGSIIDLFSSRADMRRFAGERLERLQGGAGLSLALDTYEKAAIARPDHPASHRLLAFARLKRGEPESAFKAILAGVEQRYPSGRFAGVERILREDLGLIGAAWIKAEPRRRAEIQAKVKAAAGVIEDAPSLRFVLNWETDANDVDFHIYDDRGGHAFYSQRSLPSGGELYDDVTTGYGPECFTIRGPKDSRAGSYTLQAHYYSRGPMGFGMGKLQIIDHDGKGGLSFDERPFVVMTDHAFVDLGVVKR